MQRHPILVIDDDPRACELIHAILTTGGYKVVLALDGPSGIEQARTVQPIVILLDMMMPDIDGINTLEQLKRDPVLADIPVVGITASTDLSYTGQAFRAGAGFFLAKPLCRDSLLQVVELAAERVRREPRRYPRFPAKLPVRCVIRGEGERACEVVGQTGNVSLSGLLVWMPETLALGTVSRVQLELPTGTVTAEGKVVWQDDEVGDQIVPHGIQFLRFVEEADSDQYRRYLDEIAASQRA